MISDMLVQVGWILCLEAEAMQSIMVGAPSRPLVPWLLGSREQQTREA